MTMAFLGALLHPSGRYSSFIIIHGSQNNIWAILSFPSWTPLFNLVMKPAIPAPSPTRSRSDGLCPNPSVVCHCTQSRLLTLYHDPLGSPPQPCLSPWCHAIPQAPTFFASFCFWNSGSPSCLQASALLLPSSRLSWGCRLLLTYHRNPTLNVSFSKACFPDHLTSGSCLPSLPRFPQPPLCFIFCRVFITI